MATKQDEIVNRGGIPLFVKIRPKQAAKVLLPGKSMPCPDAVFENDEEVKRYLKLGLAARVTPKQRDAKPVADGKAKSSKGGE